MLTSFNHSLLVGEMLVFWYDKIPTVQSPDSSEYGLVPTEFTTKAVAAAATSFTTVPSCTWQV
jgi:hypothetical protein